MTDQKRDDLPEFDEHVGAVEGNRASDPQQGNPNGPGVDSEGMPNDPVATCEDVLGANLDETEGG
jgi:hypothetical protein